MVGFFYFLGIVFFIYEVYVIQNAPIHLRLVRELESRAKKRNRGEEVEEYPKDWSEWTDDQKRILRHGIFAILYFLWLVIGALFSHQWIVFVGILAMGFAISFYRKRIYPLGGKGALNVVKFDAIVSALAIAFVMLNHFHHIL